MSEVEVKAPVMTLEELELLLQQTAETDVDMTEEQKGGAGRKLLPEGYTLARLCGLVERGDQPQEFLGEAKAPQPEIQLSFELYGDDYLNEDGSPYVEHCYPFSVTRTAKSNAFKLFKILNWQGDKTRWLELVGKPFIVKIVQYLGADKKTKKSRIELLSTLPPLDTLSKKPHQVQPLSPANLRVFLWNAPQLAHWDSLEIKGNNFIQEGILGAVNFAGSALEQLLLTSGREIKIPEKKEKAVETKAAASGLATPDIAGPDNDIPFDGGKPVETGEVAVPDMPDAM